MRTGLGMKPTLWEALFLGALVACSAGTPAGSDLAKRDSEVLVAVINDFASATDHCSPTATDHPVLVSSTTLSASVMTSDAQLRSELKDEEWSQIGELLEGLRERGSVERPFDWKASASVGVKVADLALRKSDSGLIERYSDARCHLRLWLPGHSEDRKRALVRFMWGPSPHGASATYLLERGDAGWRIVWRHFAIYA